MCRYSAVFATIVVFATAAAAQDLPQPPMQDKPWTAPKQGLPKPLVSATTALFQAGMADPRGCEYREVKVAVGNCWNGGGGVIATHGWVLPAVADAKKRHAVCWNGLVYPVSSVGDKADLAADVRAPKPDDNRRLRHAIDEGTFVSHQTSHPLKACLLIRLGEVELARQCLPKDEDREQPKDPFLELASQWLWAQCDRALCAHMRADDELALATVRPLARSGPMLEHTAMDRGHKRRQDDNGKEVPHFSFLHVVPRLLADQEGRAKARAASQGKIKDRTLELIRDLQNVDARQWGQPGGVSLNLDGRIIAMAKQGRPAVEPLLACLEKDQRLTRSVGFGRDFFTHRYVITVAEAAHEALSQILSVDSFGDGANRWAAREPDGQRRAAAIIRAHWLNFKDRPDHERWLTQLTTDGLTRDQYVEAAAKLVSQPRRDLERMRQPTVTEALVQRIRSLAAAGHEGSERVWALGSSCSIALRLETWDPKAAAAEMPLQFTRCLEYWKKHQEAGVAHSLAQVTQARARLGDAGAFRDYAAWLEATTPEKVSDYQAAVLEPLWRFPEDRQANRLATALFADAKSPWRELVRDPLAQRWGGRGLIESPLLGLVGFREAVIAALEDKTKLDGSFVVRAEDMDYRYKGAHGGWGIVRDADTLPAGTTIEARRGDLVAHNLCQVHGLPRFGLHWPERKRDAAIAETIVILRRYGNRLQFDPQLTRFDWYADKQAAMAFPKLDEAATTEDVRFGVAIFSLRDLGQTRQVTLPTRPLEARLRPRYDKEPEYARDGLVWQAEEVQKDGKWQRYFGFVGRGPVAKIAAADIEFPSPYGWDQLTNGLDAKVETECKDEECKFAAGKPVNVKLRLRNRSGVDRTLPKTWTRTEPAPALRAGLKFELERAAGKKWEPVPGKLGTFEKADGTLLLAPAVGAEIMRLNLADNFDLRPGSYRLRIRFEKSAAVTGEGSTGDLTFVIE